MRRLFRHERKRETEEGVLLHNTWQRSGTHATDVVRAVEGRRRWSSASFTSASLLWASHTVATPLMTYSGMLLGPASALAMVFA